MNRWICPIPRGKNRAGSEKTGVVQVSQRAQSAISKAAQRWKVNSPLNKQEPT
jgi:hypothetical protein